MSTSAPSGDAPATSTEPRAGLGRAAGAIFSVTLLSRFGGLARDVIVARLFGDTAVNSAFQSAFTIPNLFRRLFGEGALSAAFIPIYTHERRAETPGSPRPTQGDRLASLTLIGLGLGTGLLTVAGELALLLLLALLPADPERDLSLRLMMVMLPFMPFICLVAILAGMLQVHGKFAASSTGPLLLNAFIIAIGLYAMLTGRLNDHAAAHAIGIATTLSGLTQALWFARLLRPYVRWTRDTAAARAAGALMLRRFVPVVLGLGTLQLMALVDMAIAMWPIWVGPTILGFDYPLDRRSNGILANAQRLYQFPLGVFGIAVATAVFPMLARLATDPPRFAATLRRGLILSLFLGLPASAGLILVRHDAIAVLFGRWGAAATQDDGAGFSAEGVARAAAVLLGYSLGVWAFALNHVLARGFYARGDTSTPMRVALALVPVNIVCTIALIPWFREAGLAWSTSLTAIIQCAVLTTLLGRAAGTNAWDRPALGAAARIAIATALMSAACLGINALMPPATRWGLGLVRLLALCGTGAVTFGLASLLLGLHSRLRASAP
ncbi:MAG: murein biosynthesis integral membrane protein MurJ [Phycisphaerae bacterium]|nr:murein biosynthesis integral membrane protein MurJ [Phycisphaerae bacterium]